MTDTTPEDLIELAVKALPYPDQIRDWDLSTEDSAVRFTWRDTRFRVSTNLFVEEVTPPVLRGSNISIILEALLKYVQAHD